MNHRSHRSSFPVIRAPCTTKWPRLDPSRRTVRLLSASVSITPIVSFLARSQLPTSDSTTLRLGPWQRQFSCSSWSTFQFYAARHWRQRVLTWRRILSVAAARAEPGSLAAERVKSVRRAVAARRERRLRVQLESAHSEILPGWLVVRLVPSRRSAAATASCRRPPSTSRLDAPAR